MTVPDNVNLVQSIPVRVRDQVLDVAMCGPEDGVPVLMLHGFPASRASFATVAPLLVEQGLRLVVPDQRGYSAGARPADPEAYHIEELVEDVIGLLDVLDLDSVHVVGHDWGAMVAWATAAWHPARLRSLTALSVPHPSAFAWARANDVDQQQGSDYINLLVIPGKAERVLLSNDARALRQGFFGTLDQTIVDRHVRVLQEPDALTGALNWYRCHDHVLGEIPSVAVDTTLVWGAEDPALRRAGVLRCGAHVTGTYRFVELAGAGHWIPEAHPDVVADEVLRHVRRSTTTIHTHRRTR